MDRTKSLVTGFQLTVHRVVTATSMLRAVAAVDADVGDVAVAGVGRTASGHRLPPMTGMVRAKQVRALKLRAAVIGV